MFGIDIDQSAGLPIGTAAGCRVAGGYRDVPDESCAAWHAVQCGSSRASRMQMSSRRSSPTWVRKRLRLNAKPPCGRQAERRRSRDCSTRQGNAPRRSIGPRLQRRGNGVACPGNRRAGHSGVGEAVAAKNSEAWRRSARCWTGPPGLLTVGVGANQVLSGEATHCLATRMAVYYVLYAHALGRRLNKATSRAARHAGANANRGTRNEVISTPKSRSTRLALSQPS